MSPKTKIAVLVAALFLGAQAGIAALDQQAATSAEATETTQEQQAEATTEATPTEAPATAAAEQPAAEAPAAPAQIVRVPVSSTFPRSPDGRDMLPGLAAYLEQVEASRAHLVARGDVFPRSVDGMDPLPGMIAYLDQRDATRIARAQEQQQPAPVAPAAAIEPAPVALAPQQPASGN